MTQCYEKPSDEKIRSQFLMTDLDMAQGKKMLKHASWSLLAELSCTPTYAKGMGSTLAAIEIERRKNTLASINFITCILTLLSVIALLIYSALVVHNRHNQSYICTINEGKKKMFITEKSLFSNGCIIDGTAVPDSCGKSLRYSITQGFNCTKTDLNLE